jgi:hypothetical protein
VFTGPPSSLGFQENPGSAALKQQLASKPVNPKEEVQNRCPCRTSPSHIQGIYVWLDYFWQLADSEKLLRQSKHAQWVYKLICVTYVHGPSPLRPNTAAVRRWRSATSLKQSREISLLALLQKTAPRASVRTSRLLARQTLLKTELVNDLTSGAADCACA